MPFSTRNPAALTVGTTYNFTRASNGYTYKMTFTGTRQGRTWTQESQWFGNSSNPMETIYEFTSQHATAPKPTAQWVWEHDIHDGAYTDGTWTEC